MGYRAKLLLTFSRLTLASRCADQMPRLHRGVVTVNGGAANFRDVTVTLKVRR